MAKKKETAVIYEVLVPCTNKRGVDFEVGDTVTKDDFPAAVIKNWLTITPPVLKVKDGK